MSNVTSLYLKNDTIEKLDKYLNGRISRSSAIRLMVEKFLNDPKELI